MKQYVLEYNDKGLPIEDPKSREKVTRKQLPAARCALWRRVHLAHVFKKADLNSEYYFKLHEQCKAWNGSLISFDIAEINVRAYQVTVTDGKTAYKGVDYV